MYEYEESQNENDSHKSNSKRKKRKVELLQENQDPKLYEEEQPRLSMASCAT
jgi:hypothetical protein